MKFGVNDIHDKELKQKGRVLYSWIDSKRNPSSMALFNDLINALVRFERKSFRLEQQIEKQGKKKERFKGNGDIF